MTTTRLDAPFYRLRIVQPITALFYLGSGLALWAWFDLQLAGTVLIGFVALQIINATLPIPFASGYFLQSDGFVLQQGPFGKRRTFYGYEGFVRLFALPVRNQYIIAFNADRFNFHPQSDLANRVLSHQEYNGYIWLITPRTHNPQFPVALIEHAALVTFADIAPDITQAYQAFLAHRRSGNRRLWPFG